MDGHFLRVLATLSVIIAVPLSGTQAATMTSAQATALALRLSNTITGGVMPTSDPIFTAMVSKLEGGDIQGAALLAADSNYFAQYLARRLALQMQNPALNSAISSDNDATAFLIAHFVGTPTTQPSISSIWSDNSTYVLNTTCPTASGAITSPCHAADLSPTQLQSINWGQSLTQKPGQTALLAAQPTGNKLPSVSASGSVAISTKHVGGYLTLSDRAGDNSFAMYGATAGTNLRMIEGMWMIGTGFQITAVESSATSPSAAPKFVPENDSSFFHGVGQTACMACHGGGMSSLTHGYSAVADVFNYDPALGLSYNAVPTNPALMKSLGSNTSVSARQLVAACNVEQNPTLACNSDSTGADPNQAWDLSLWSSTGILGEMGWAGATQGQGLNALGQALGQTSIVYQYLAKRIVGEICPLGMFTQDQINTITPAAAGLTNPDALAAASTAATALANAMSSVLNNASRKAASTTMTNAYCAFSGNNALSVPTYGSSLFDPTSSVANPYTSVTTASALAPNVTIASLTGEEQAQIAAYYNSAMGITGGVVMELAGRDYHGQMPSLIAAADIEEARAYVMFLTACLSAKKRGAMIHVANGEAMASGIDAVTTTINGASATVNAPRASSDAGGYYNGGLIFFFDPNGSPPQAHVTGSLDALNGSVTSAGLSPQQAMAGLYLSAMSWVGGAIPQAAVTAMNNAVSGGVQTNSAFVLV